MKTTSIRLTEEEESALTELAEKMKCRSRYGATSGQPSWRVMLQHLAEGRLTISNPLDKSRKVFINFKRAPGWWKPDENDSMDAAEVAAKYKTTVEILEEKGFVVSGGRIYPGNWKGWKQATAAEPKAVKLRDSKFPVSTVSPPSWLVPAEKDWPAMLVEEAETASGYSRGAMEASGMLLQKTHDGKLIVAWPHDPAWVVAGDDPEPEKEDETEDYDHSSISKMVKSKP